MTNQLITPEYVDQIFDRIRMSKTGWKAAFCNAEEVQGYKSAMADALTYLNVTDHEVVANAIRQAIISTGDFMPSVGTFCDWCKPEQKEQCHNLLPRLEKTEATPEQKAKFLAELNEAAKGIN
tara:strand:- start:3259 stop:3627 length:369 start_codon:yes stop_codon:yes gene_type:complete